MKRFGVIAMRSRRYLFETEIPVIFDGFTSSFLFEWIDPILVLLAELAELEGAPPRAVPERWQRAHLREHELYVATSSLHVRGARRHRSRPFPRTSMIHKEAKRVILVNTKTGARAELVAREDKLWIEGENARESVTAIGEMMHGAHLVQRIDEGCAPSDPSYVKSFEINLDARGAWVRLFLVAASHSRTARR